MIEPKIQDMVLRKVGSKFKMVSLIQKRMRELVRGLPPLVDIGTTDIWQIAQQEILAGKVELVMGEEAEKLRKDQATKEADELATRKGSKDKPKPAEEAPPPVVPPLSPIL